MYTAALPAGWEAAQPPSPRISRGSLSTLRDWAVREIQRRPNGVVVAGHSMGAALAVLAAVTAPEHVEGLLLIAPAGLPLSKPLRRSAAECVRQATTRTYA